MMHKKGIIADIAYHDYAVLITHIDAERFFRTCVSNKRANNPIAPFTEPNDIFAKECIGYRNELGENLHKLGKANETENKFSFKDFLYNPLCFVAFGSSDNVAIVAMDDFDLTTKLTSLTELPVRQTCLAFCPKLDSLELDSLKIDSQPIFCELGDICKDSPSILACKDAIVTPRHTFLKNRPLIGVTYYKLNGMAVLGPGLLLQQATYRAMAKKIKQTLDALVKQTHAGYHNDIMSEEDIKSFRCTFLDPQGWSDVVTLMFCRNYSVIATVLVALSSITFQDLYDTDTSKKNVLKDAVACFGIHKRMANIFDSIMQRKHISDQLLSENHAFCSTFSTFGISHEAFEKSNYEEAKNYYDGIVIADTNFDIDPGHVADAYKAMAKKYKANPQELKQSYVWYTIGQNDFAYRQLVEADCDANKALKLFEFLQQIKSLRDCPVPQCQKVEPCLTSHVLETCTELRIPIPVILNNELKKPGIRLNTVGEGHIDIDVVLDKLREKLFQETTGTKSFFDINALRGSIRKIRLPVPLSSSIVFLYTDFAKCLSDPFLFDSVIDLYDTFTAVYQLLTVELPDSLEEALRQKLEEEIGENLGREPSQKLKEKSKEILWQKIEESKKIPTLWSKLDAVCRTFLGDEDIKNLVKLVDLLHNALIYRSQVTFREVEKWNVTVDIRGDGLERLINASDALLKSGLGMLRRVKSGYTDVYRPPELSPEKLKELSGEPQKLRQLYSTIERDNRRKICGASKISYNPRSTSERLTVGTNSDIFVASVDLNIAHLFRPRALCVHFHEVGHLICDLLRIKGCTHPEYSCNLSCICCHKKNVTPKSKNSCDTLIHERYEEIFVEMLVHQFIFQDDFKVYYRNYFANHSFNPIAYCKQDKDTLLRMFEMSIRGFLTIDPFRSRAENQQLYSGDANPKLVQTQAYHRFLEAIKNAGPFFFEFERLYYNQGIRENFEEYFAKVFTEAYHPVCCIWHDIQKIYKGICEQIEPDIEERKKLDLAGTIKQAFADGKPLIRLLYRNPRATGCPEETDRSRLNPFYLISYLLKEHIATAFDEETGNVKNGLRVCLVRNPKDGRTEIDNLLGNKKWHKQLVDRNFNDWFTIEPEVRSQYMRNRIVLIKTLWDISTNLRARRMKDAMEIAWPQLYPSASLHNS